MVHRPSPLALQHPNACSSSPYKPAISSALAIPTSPMSPRTPLTSPRFLHLPTLIPSSLVLTSDLISPPSFPYPWIWRCHLCHSVYRLGVTRRCLEDGHFFCSLPHPPSSPVSEISDASDSDDLSAKELLKRQEHRHRTKVKKEGRRRKRRQLRGCRAEFDYTGWSNHNNWRREVRLFKSVLSSTSESEFGSANSHARFQEMIESGESNCWTDCEFPSECHNFRLERLGVARAAAKLELTHKASRDKLTLTQEWENIQAELEVEEQVKEMFEDDKGGNGVTSGEEDDIALRIERRGMQDEAELEIVDLTVSSHVVSSSTTGMLSGFSSRNLVGDVIGEEEKEIVFIEKKRRKSIPKVHQLTGLMLGTGVDISVSGTSPSSPLKKISVEEDLWEG